MQPYDFPVPPDGDIDQGWAILSVCWAFVLCAFISTALRLWVRTKITRNLGWDDFWMLVAMVTTIIGAALVTAEVIEGLGRHEFYLTAEQKRLNIVIGWADWIQTFITLCVTKVSICLFLLRIVDSRRTRFAMYAVIGFTVLFTTICVAFFLGICRPLRAYWDVGVDGSCLSSTQIKQVVIAQGVLSAVTDLICASFPIIVLRNLQINLRTKVGLCILMGLGVITAACCIVRTALSGSITNVDMTWAIVANTGWRLPEVNIGIVCANAPVLRPLYLWSRGMLSSQRAASTGVSNDKLWPSDPMRYKAGSRLRDRLSWDGHNEYATTSAEMGLPMHESRVNGGV